MIHHHIRLKDSGMRYAMGYESRSDAEDECEVLGGDGLFECEDDNCPVSYVRTERKSLRKRAYAPRQLKTNTKLARRLAEIYKDMTGDEFPGGVENAYIDRTYAGHWQRSSGAMSWVLEPIERTDPETGKTRHVTAFGSVWPAAKAVKNPHEMIVLFDLQHIFNIGSEIA